MSNTIESPKGSCRYEMYDIETLAPSNDSTRIRLIECNWDRSVFYGKTILDIGCNSGALSVFAARHGAKSVLAVDVQQQLLDFVDQVQKRHDLPIRTKKSTLANLDARNDSADIVLCMEVLHWVVHQGENLRTAIAQLAALTKETLFIETPWDIKEPSIAEKANYPTQEYDIEIIIRELSRHFEVVRFEKFMTYFGDMVNSKRILLKAERKRSGSLGARHLEDANLAGLSLCRGVNELELVTSRTGTKVLKCIPEQSLFAKLPDKVTSELCKFLGSAPAETGIVAPERFGARYVQREVDDKFYMIFPFVGDLDDFFPSRRNPRPARNPLAAAARISRFFTSADPTLVDQVRQASRRIPNFDVNSLPEVYANSLSNLDCIDLIKRCQDIVETYKREDEIALAHFDLQLGNIVWSPNGKDYVVDFDLMRSAPLYVDLISCAVYTGASGTVLNENYQSILTYMPRPVDRLDIAFALTSNLLWLAGMTKAAAEYENQRFSIFVKGIIGVTEFCAAHRLFD